MSKVLIVLSGGQDSTTCLFQAKDLGHEVHALTINYGQRHGREISAAQIVAERAGVLSHEVLDLGPILKGTSPLVSENELEQYEDKFDLPGGIEKTFVPMRNQLFLTLAANRAVVLGCDEIWTGVCQEDFGGYPDCRDVFIIRLNQAILESLRGSVDRAPVVVTPLMYLDKASTVRLALQHPGCYEALAFSHTGYDGAYPPTGKDHATQLRAKGFEEAGVPDPLVLRAYLEGLMALPDTPNYQGADLPEYVSRVANAMAEEHELDFDGIQAFTLNNPGVLHRALGEALGEDV